MADPILPFSEFIELHNQGDTNSEVARSLAEVVDAAHATGKAGSVTVTVSVEPSKGNARLLFTTVKVTSKVPVDPPESDTFWAGPKGRLSREDPGQGTLELTPPGGVAQLR